MKKALNTKNNYKIRARAFDKLYKDYCREYGNDDGWWDYRVSLRKKFANELTDRQEKDFGLTSLKVKKAFFEILKNKKKGNSYPSEFFYQLSLSIILKFFSKDDSILEIGCGEFPILEKILDKKGINYFGLDPFIKNVNNKNLFKARISKLPKKLNQKYDLILANMVYTINYTDDNSKYFKWELENKPRLLKTISKLLNEKGYFISIDDIGTIFTKRELEKYFKILVYEKDMKIRDFNNKGKVLEYCRVIVLRKK